MIPWRTIGNRHQRQDRRSQRPVVSWGAGNHQSAEQHGFRKRHPQHPAQRRNCCRKWRISRRICPFCLLNPPSHHFLLKRPCIKGDWDVGLRPFNPTLPQHVSIINPSSEKIVKKHLGWGGGGAKVGSWWVESIYPTILYPFCSKGFAKKCWV